MAATQRRFSKEEMARRGDALVESKVRPHLTATDADKFVAIDIETGEYELHKNEMRAAERLRKRFPDAAIWLVHGLPPSLRRVWRARRAMIVGVVDRFAPPGQRGFTFAPLHPCVFALNLYRTVNPDPMNFDSAFDDMAIEQEVYRAAHGRRTGDLRNDDQEGNGQVGEVAASDDLAEGRRRWAGVE